MAKTAGANGARTSGMFCEHGGTTTPARTAVDEGGTGVARASWAGSEDTAEDAATRERRPRGEVSTLLARCTAAIDDE
jgi:hypothetical protein